MLINTVSFCCVCVSVCVPHVHLIFCTYRYMQTFVDDSDPVLMYTYMYVLYTLVCQCIHANIYTSENVITCMRMLA